MAPPFTPQRMAFIMANILPALEQLVQGKKPDQMPVIRLPYDLLTDHYENGEMVMIHVKFSCQDTEAIRKKLHEDPKKAELAKGLEFSLANNLIPCLFLSQAPHGLWALLIPFQPMIKTDVDDILQQPMCKGGNA